MVQPCHDLGVGIQGTGSGLAEASRQEVLCLRVRRNEAAGLQIGNKEAEII